METKTNFELLEIVATGEGQEKKDARDQLYARMETAGVLDMTELPSGSPPG